MINVDEDNLKQGLLGLVIAIIEIIRDTLRLQAMKRIESGRLTEEETERLGSALSDLDTAIEEMKKEQGVEEAVKSVRDGLDDVANDIIDQFINPKKWVEEEKVKEKAITPPHVTGGLIEQTGTRTG